MTHRSELDPAFIARMRAHGVEIPADLSIPQFLNRDAAELESEAIKDGSAFGECADREVVEELEGELEGKLARELEEEQTNGWLGTLDVIRAAGEVSNGQINGEQNYSLRIDDPTDPANPYYKTPEQLAKEDVLKRYLESIYGPAKRQEPPGEKTTEQLDVRDAGDDTELPPPRRWLLGNQFCRRFLSGLVAPGATGKTALRTLQYLSLATGRALTGQHVFKRCRVLAVSLEDDQEEMQRRHLAAMLEHGIPRNEVKGWLFYACPKGIKLAEIKNGSRQIGELERQLRAWIEKHKPDLVGLDPFVKLHALEENDNGAMDFVCDLLVTLAIEYDIAVDAPHHTKKGQLAPGDPDAGRGGSAARDAGRLIYTLTAMSEEEAQNFGIKPEDRAAYVRLDKGKVNLAPPMRTAEWFKLVGVRLDNGNDEYPNGDEVQTVKLWNPPKIWDGVAAEALNAALTEIDQGMPNGQRYTAAGGSKGRAAWRVVQKHCADRTEEQCREIVRIWVRNGVLYPVEYDDPIDRKPRNGLRLDTTKRPS